METPTHSQFIDLSRSSQNYYTFCLGTSWDAAASILGEGIIRPANFEAGSLPNSAFYGQGAVGWMSDENVKDCVRRSYASPKGQNDALFPKAPWFIISAVFGILQIWEEFKSKY